MLHFQKMILRHMTPKIKAASRQTDRFVLSTARLNFFPVLFVSINISKLLLFCDIFESIEDSHLWALSIRFFAFSFDIFCEVRLVSSTIIESLPLLPSNL